MSKPIKLTPDILADAKKEFEEQLSSLNTKMFDGKVTFTKTYKWKGDDKATIIFTPGAYFKMFRLIQEFSDEVAWHGVAYRDAEDSSVFHITDIIVYPQTVTGSTVNTNQVEYETWLMGLDDEIFNNLRMQGHSHVNMTTTPSGVDTSHQEAILNQLEDSMFYIFMIWNKSLSHNIKIFDLQNNTLYEDGDVIVKIAAGDEDYDEFIKKAKDLVVKKTYQYSSGYNKGTQTTVQTGGTTQKKEEKKETKNENENKVGNGWNNRGMSSLENYYDDGYYGGYGGYPYR